MDPALSLNPGAGAGDKAGKQSPTTDGPAADLQMIWNRAGSARGLTMSKMLGRKGLGALLSMLAMGAHFPLRIGRAGAADEVTEGQSVRALGPAAKAPLTRGLSTAPQADPAATAAEGRLLHAIRGRATRSLSVSEREEIATIAKDKPNIDLEITFDYNSANISTKSLPSVQALGKALTNPDLKRSTFIVAGHTDAAGGETYNQDLSERRADSIKRYLTDKFGIVGSDLVTRGYGKSNLDDPADPLA